MILLWEIGKDFARLFLMFMYHWNFPLAFVKMRRLGLIFTMFFFKFCYCLSMAVNNISTEH